MKITMKNHHCGVKLSSNEQLDWQQLDCLTSGRLPMLISPGQPQGWKKHILQYDTASYASLSFYLACSPTNDQLLQVVLQCIDVFQQLPTCQLSSQNLLLSLDKIYVDLRTHTVRFLYIPLVTSTLQGDAKGFLTTLFSQISPSNQLQATLSQQCLTYLANNTPLDLALFSRFVSKVGTGQAPPRGQLLLRVSTQERIPLNQSPFLVGLDPDLVHYCIDNNLFISRCHAQFSLEGEHFSLTDLDSRNGTRVNGHPLQPHVPVALLPGMQIVFANEVFQYNES